MRSFFATELISSGGDLLMFCDLLGLKDPAVTMRYEKRSEQAKRKAVSKLTLPLLKAG